jgi:hypothetical protein
MMKRRAKVCCVLAFLVNVGGGPAAWAQLAGNAKCHAMELPVATETSPDCHEHDKAIEPSESDKHVADVPSCCDDGSCTCVLSHTVFYFAFVGQSARLAPAPLPEMALPSAPLPVIDDSLRPPIR